MSDRGRWSSRRFRIPMAICAIALAPAACVMDGPFVDSEIDALTSASQASPWAPAGVAPRVTPLAIPVAANGDGQQQRLREESVVGAPLLVRDPVHRMSLTECIDVALAASPLTRAAWESARATAATVGIADAAYYPDISFVGGMGPEQSMSGPIRLEQTVGTAALTMTWVLMDFGRRDADSARARIQLEGANYSFNRQMQKLVFAVQRAYFTLDAKLSLKAAAHENVATARKQLDATDDRMTVGLATRPEVLQARQQYLQAIYDLENAKAEVYTAQADLAVAMGVPADRSPEIMRLAELPLPNSLSMGVEVAIRSSLLQRPDIAAALADVRALSERVKRAEADFLPIVAFEGSGGVSSQNYNSQTEPQSIANTGSSAFGTYSASLSASWLLFDGYERANILRQARSEVQAAQARLEQLRLVTTGEVWAGYFDFFSAQRRYEAGEALLTASQDSYDSVYQNYLNGLATINDLLLAESFLFDARFELIRSRAELLTASATFVLALGS